MNTKFRQAPGLIYDWISMMTLKLNDRGKWINGVVNAGFEKDDLSHIAFWLSKFSEPDAHLNLFFYLPDRLTPCCFMSTFQKAMGESQGALTAEQVLGWADNERFLRQAVIGYYLPKAELATSLQQLAEMIQHTKLPGDIQFLLLEFLMNPEPFMEALKEWSVRYQQQMEDIYQHYIETAMKWQETISEEELWQCYAHFQSPKKRGNLRQFSKMTEAVYSMTVIMKNAIVFQIDNSGWFILGTEFRKSLVLQKELRVSAELIGNAVGDRNRAAIVTYILEEGEKSSSDIAKKLGIALNTAAYHLDVMRKARLLSSRNQGKTAYYWVNSQACQAASEIFGRWAKGEK